MRSSRLISLHFREAGDAAMTDARMILRTSPNSPYGRKVEMAIAHAGLTGRIEIVGPGPQGDEVRGLNPLGKIPVLLAGGRAIFDSPVIVQYVDHLAGGGKVIPTDPQKRFA